MAPQSIAPLVVSIVALVISVASGSFAAVRLRMDVLDRRRRLDGERPFFVVRSNWKIDDDGQKQPWVRIANEGTAVARDVSVWFQVEGDPEATAFGANAASLGPEEFIETTNPIIRHASRAPWTLNGPSQWDSVRIQVGYRLPHATRSFVVTPQFLSTRV